MAAPEPGSRVGPVPLDQVLRKDLPSVTPRGLRVDEAIEREVLEILQQAVLTSAMLDRLLTEVNAGLRAQATVSRPRITELRRALSFVDREIADYTRAIARGDFSSLEQALAAAEQRHRLPRGRLEQEGIGLFGGHPHRTPSPVLLEVALIQAPEIHDGIAGEPPEFF